MGWSIIIIIMLLIIMWIILSNKISTNIDRTESLKRDIYNLNTLIHQLLRENIKLKEEPEPIKPEPEIISQKAEVTPELVEIKAEPIVETEIEPEPEKVKEEIIPQPEIIAEPKVVYNPLPPRNVKKRINYEKFIGENLFGKIGILILVIGIGFFVKYAIDNQWINETFRTILGYAVGGGLLFVAERLHKKYRPFSSLLAGGAFAIFYVTTAIAYHYYELFSQTAAFIILVGTTLLMAILSLLYDRKELAITALVGGFFAPFLVSSGEGNYIVLFTYMLVLNSGMFVLSIYKKWGELPIISFFFTWLCMFIYAVSANVTPTIAQNLLYFSTGFFLLFLLPITFIMRGLGTGISYILLSILAVNNFIFMAFGLYFIGTISPSVRLDGLLTLFIALINLGIAFRLRKQLSDNKPLLYALLGIVVTFVSITIPLQLKGNYITIFWAAEMVLLMWLFIKSGYHIYKYFSLALCFLTIISWCMDVSNVNATARETTIFFNGFFVTGLFTSLAFLAHGILTLKNNVQTAGFKQPILNVGAIFAACFIFWITFRTELDTHIEGYYFPALLKGTFTAAYLFLLNLVLRKRFSVKHYLPGYIMGAGVNLLAFFFTYLKMSDNWNDGALEILISWIYLGFVMLHVIDVAGTYYKLNDYKKSTGFTIGLNITGILLLLAATRMLLFQTSLVHEFNAGFSICLGIAGFVQMILGMRLHSRLLRIISLYTFGIVVVKLLLIDLWLLPTVGKIIVFIILGIILLLLSFMYQKLKTVLLKEENVEKNESNE